jgi:hypothetical protein
MGAFKTILFLSICSDYSSYTSLMLKTFPPNRFALELPVAPAPDNSLCDSFIIVDIHIKVNHANTPAV